VGGQGAISAPNANTTLIQQQSHNLALEWQSFNVQAQELVRFQQPSASAAVLNRILDQNPSQIFGAIEANGRVFLANPNGLIFGRTATVNVGSLVAASLEMDPAKFMEGSYEMGLPDGKSPGSVINRGMIKAATGGTVTLVGGAVSNEGLIVADVGYVHLASGRKAVVDFEGNGLIRFRVDEALLGNDSGAQAAVANSGEIRAEGGTVVLAGHTARDVFSQVVNNEGVVHAGSIDKSGGKIRLTGLGGLVANSGSLDASGVDGGSVEIVGEQITQSGSIVADGSAGDGGRVKLESADTTLLTGTSITSARSNVGGKGGSVQLLGDKVGLLENAEVDASGEQGGGEVLVGGDYQGKNPDIKNASQTYVGAETSIKADAGKEGDGGKVIVWADETTRFVGQISARGGTESGDGGFVETSGKRHLTAQGSVDAGAASGEAGTWLLDPTNVDIVDTITGNEVTGAGGTFDPSGQAPNAQVLSDNIESSLEGGTNVTVHTGDNTDSELGNIRLQTDITVDLSSNGAVTLTLDAANDIELNDSIWASNNPLNVELLPNSENYGTQSGIGVVRVNASDPIEIITAGGFVVLFRSLILNNDLSVDTGAGDIVLNKIDGAHSLVLDAGVGKVVLGAVGGNGKLANLTVSAASQVDLADVYTTGAQSVTAANIDLNGKHYESDDGNITFTAPVDLIGAGISIDSDANNDATDGNITFTNTVDGGQSLTLDADTGAISLGAVGGTALIDGLMITSAGQVNLANVSTTGAQAITGVNIDLNGTIYEANDGNITFTGPANLIGAGIRVDSDANNDAIDGNITFTDAVNGNQSLTLDASTGGVSLGAAGATTRLTSLTVSNAGQVDLANVFTIGAQSVTGGSIDLNGTTYKSNDGNITFTGPVNLVGVGISIDSDADNDATDGNITLTSTVNGPQTLTLDADRGAVSLGVVGDVTRISSLTISNAGQVDLANVFTIGAQSVTGVSIDLNGTTYESDDESILFIGPVSLIGAGVRVNSDADNDATDGNIIFTGTVDGGQSLALNAGTGTVGLGAVGDVTRISSLTVSNAGQVDLENVFTTGVQSVTGTNINLNGTAYESNDGHITFTGPVDLIGAGISIDSDVNNDATDGNITFTSTVDGAQTLTLNADTGAVSLGAVGGTIRVDSLTVSNAGQVDLANAFTDGAQSVTGVNIDLNGRIYESNDGNITFSGPVDLMGAGISIDSDANNDAIDGNITFSSTVDGGATLALDADTGAVSLGAVGGTTAVSSFTASGNTITMRGDIITADVAGNNVSLIATALEMGNHTITTNNVINDGNVTFMIDLLNNAGTVNAGAATFQLRPAAVTHNIEFAASDDPATSNQVFYDSSFASITAGSFIIGGDTHTGDIHVGNSLAALTFNPDLTAQNSGGGRIFLNSNYTSAGGDLNLTSGGSVSVRDLAGDTTATVNLGVGSFSETGNVTLVEGADITATGGITFGGAVDGGQSLALNAGTGAVSLGAVGATTRIDSLTISNAGQVDLEDVFTTGAQSVMGINIDLNGRIYESNDGNITFSGPVDLMGAGISIDSDANNDAIDGNITFSSTVDGGATLALDADTGAVSLGAVGGTTAVSSFTASGDTITMGGSITTADVVGNNVSLIATALEMGSHMITTNNVTHDGNVTFAVDRLDNAGAVDAGAATFQIRPATATHIIEFAASDDPAITNQAFYDSAFASIMAGSFIIGGDTHTGDIHVGNSLAALTFNPDLTAQNSGGGQIYLNSDYASAGGDLNLTSGGSVSVRDLAGDTTATVNLGVGSFSETGNVTLVEGADITATGGITFGGTVDGGQSLALNAGTGAVSLGAVGATTRIDSLTISNAGQVDLEDVFTTGAQSITGTNIDLNGTLYESNDGTIAFMGAVNLIGAGINIDSDADNDAIDGDIKFTGAVDGEQSLTLDADQGTVMLGQVTRVTGVTVTGGSINLNGNITTGVGDSHNVDLATTVSGITLPNINLTGDFKVTAAGAIDQAADSALIVGGNSNYNAGDNVITLTNDGNNFIGAVSLNNSGANGVTIVNSSALELAASSLGSGTFSATGVGITQSGAIVQAAGADTANFSAGANAITLTNASNDFTGAVSLNSVLDTAIVDSNALTFGASSVGQDLRVTTSGNVGQTGILTVVGTSAFDVQAAMNVLFDLGNAANDLGGAVTLNATGGGSFQDISLSNASPSAATPSLPTSVQHLTLTFDNAAISLPALSLSGNLSVTAGGDITQTGILNIDGTSSFAAGASDITLRDDGNNFSGNLTVNSANDIDLFSGGLFNIGSIAASGNIKLVGGTDVVQSGGITSAGGFIKVFADNGSLIMNPGTVTSANGGKIVYTGAGDVTISHLATTSEEIDVTSEAGDVSVTNEDVNISGSGVTAKIYALGFSNSIGSKSQPMRFEQPGVENIVLAFNQEALIDGQKGERITGTFTTAQGHPTYEWSGGNRTSANEMFGGLGDVIDMSAAQREFAGQVQATSQQEFENIDSALLKSRIKIHNVIGDGLKMPAILEEEEGISGDELTMGSKGFNLKYDLPKGWMSCHKLFPKDLYSASENVGELGEM